VSFLLFLEFWAGVGVMCEAVAYFLAVTWVGCVKSGFLAFFVSFLTFWAFIGRFLGCNRLIFSIFCDFAGNLQCQCYLQCFFAAFGGSPPLILSPPQAAGIYLPAFGGIFFDV